jgi:hypothetical protein
VYVLLALMLVAPVIGRPTGLNYLYERYADFYPLLVVYGLWIAGLWLMRQCTGGIFPPRDDQRPPRSENSRALRPSP